MLEFQGRCNLICFIHLRHLKSKLDWDEKKLQSIIQIVYITDSICKIIICKRTAVMAVCYDVSCFSKKNWSQLVNNYDDVLSLIWLLCFLKSYFEFVDWITAKQQSGEDALTRFIGEVIKRSSLVGVWRNKSRLFRMHKKLPSWRFPLQCRRWQEARREKNNKQFLDSD